MNLRRDRGIWQQDMARICGITPSALSKIEAGINSPGSVIIWRVARVLGVTCEYLLDETMLAFGWGTIYLTLFLTVLNGQTPGKKAMGIRVVQIDNRPLSWWASFERVGGYAAGLATGLLGFAQIFWDANRQAIHDKVSETVVIKVGEDRVAGPWVAGVGDEASPPEVSPYRPGESG